MESVTKVFLSLAAAMVLLTGCANRGPVAPIFPPDLRPVFSQTRDVALPAKGERATAAIGSPMATVGRKTFKEAIRIRGNVFAEGDDGSGSTIRYYMGPGTYPLSYRDLKGNRFYGAGAGKLVWVKKGKDSSADDVKVYFQLTTTNELLVSGLYPDHADLYSARVYAASFDLVESDDKVEDSIKRELVYTGRTGNSLSLLYREFINDMARPAFSQQLQYDIGSDPVIGYQGARFKVLSTDNTGITYEVLEPLRAQ